MEKSRFTDYRYTHTLTDKDLEPSSGSYVRLGYYIDNNNRFYHLTKMIDEDTFIGVEVNKDTNVTVCKQGFFEGNYGGYLNMRIQDSQVDMFLKI